MIDDEVRQMLERRARDVSPSPDAWAEIEARLAGEVAGEDRVAPPPARLHRRAPFLIAAAVLVALGVTAALVAGPDGTSRVDTGPAGPALTPPSTTFDAIDAHPEALRLIEVSVWPATDAAAHAALQAEADAGSRPDLLDPRAAAGQYLSDRFVAGPGPRVDFEVGEYRAGDAQSGEVAYLAGGLPGSVLVRRSGGEGSIWYVIALTTLRLPVEAASFDGTTVSVRVRPTVAGQLESQIAWVGEGDPVRAVQDVVAGRPVEFAETHRSDTAAVVLLRLTGADGVVSLAELRVQRASPPVDPSVAGYCTVLDSVSGERPASYPGSGEHLADIDRLLAAAPPEVAADLAAYRAFVAASVRPGDPASQDAAAWPAEVRADLARIDAHDARRCRGAS